MAGESGILSTRRGLGDKEDGDAPARPDEDMAKHGPVLMQGHVRRQGDGWKGMKPWNERFLVLRACALICYPKGGTGTADDVWKVDKVSRACILCNSFSLPPHAPRDRDRPCVLAVLLRPPAGCVAAPDGVCNLRQEGHGVLHRDEPFR
jgi:hypothetical protein